jgi:hypothetical protein
LLVPLVPVLVDPVPLPLIPLEPEAPGGQFVAELLLLLPVLPLEALPLGGQLRLEPELPLVPRLEPELPVAELPEPSELDEPLLLLSVELPPVLPVPIVLEPPVVPVPLLLVCASAAVPSDNARTETAVKSRRFIGCPPRYGERRPLGRLLLTVARRARSPMSSWSRSGAPARSRLATCSFGRKKGPRRGGPSSGRKSPKDLRRPTGNARSRTASPL